MEINRHLNESGLNLNILCKKFDVLCSAIADITDACKRSLKQVSNVVQNSTAKLYSKQGRLSAEVIYKCSLSVIKMNTIDNRFYNDNSKTLANKSNEADNKNLVEASIVNNLENVLSGISNLAAKESDYVYSHNILQNNPSFDGIAEYNSAKRNISIINRHVDGMLRAQSMVSKPSQRLFSEFYIGTTLVEDTPKKPPKKTVPKIPRAALPENNKKHTSGQNARTVPAAITKPKKGVKVKFNTVDTKNVKPSAKPQIKEELEEIIIDDDDTNTVEDKGTKEKVKKKEVSDSSSMPSDSSVDDSTHKKENVKEKDLPDDKSLSALKSSSDDDLLLASISSGSKKNGKEEKSSEKKAHKEDVSDEKSLSILKSSSDDDLAALRNLSSSSDDHKAKPDKSAEMNKKESESVGRKRKNSSEKVDISSEKNSLKDADSKTSLENRKSHKYDKGESMKEDITKKISTESDDQVPSILKSSSDDLSFLKNTASSNDTKKRSEVGTSVKKADEKKKEESSKDVNKNNDSLTSSADLSFLKKLGRDDSSSKSGSKSSPTIKSDKNDATTPSTDLSKIGEIASNKTAKKNDGSGAPSLAKSSSSQKAGIKKSESDSILMSSDSGVMASSKPAKNSNNAKESSSIKLDLDNSSKIKIDDIISSSDSGDFF